ncbi:MAG: hypothetical protein IPM12_05855 [Flavobacteriales bacterium]|nr:hypothetical protein [Flavobacteriales bacterium]
MPTRTFDTDPFTPRRPLTREELQAFAEGRLDAESQRVLEEHIEADALVRDAADGLRMPGAAVGLNQLDAMRPRSGSASRWWWAGGTVMIGLLTAWYFWPAPANDMVSAGITIDQASAAGASMEPLRTEEIAAAMEQPESLRIGHEPLALHANPMASERTAMASASVDREPGIEPLVPRGTAIDHPAEAAKPLVVRKAKSSRQLVFLHDLKLIHPKELYTADPVLALADAGVSARYADRAMQQGAAGEAIRLGYLEFMDEAIGRFARNDHKGCLDDLRFVLLQYPDDANALFYAGLCSHNLGMHARARVLLHRAAVHPVDVFDEEAAWYHALTLEKLGERDAAREAFSRIASQGGFYAERAIAKLASD